MNPASRENVFEQLKIDEGVKYEIYLDHLGFKTFGVGHLCLIDDPEYDQEIATPVSEERVQECFEKDLDIAIDECKVLFGENRWGSFPDEVQEICVNMMFNLGRPRYSKFKKHLAALDAEDWSEAAKEARDSRWYRQVGDRAERLCRRLEAIHE
mgnify:CR=1 FL=1